MASAAQIAARKKFSDIMKSGGFKKNPLTRVKKNSPSMATGKAPSTRLKKRRAKTAKAPAGYYANPDNPKRKIEGTETPDNPEGLITTKAGALKFAKSIMADDLKKAGFTASIFDGARGWVINYGKTIRKNPTILITDTPKKRTVIRRVNPVAKSVSKKGYSNFPYTVEIMRLVPSGSAKGYAPQFEMHAGFKTKAEASDLANMIADKYPNVTVRVKSYK
jgi:hypothetical protein